MLANSGGGTVTLFAFNAGESLSEHSEPFDALVLVLEGALTLTIGGNPVDARPGTVVRLRRSATCRRRLKPARMPLIMLRERPA